MSIQQAITCARAQLETQSDDALVTGLQQINAKLDAGKPLPLLQFRTLEALRTLIIGILAERAAAEFSAMYDSTVH